MHHIYNILKNFDIYGYNFRLRYKREIEYSTYCGIIFSLISISIISIISISNISKMVNGTNFSVVTNYIYTYNNIEIDLSSYPLLFGLYKNETLIEYNPSYVSIKIDRNEHIPLKDEKGNFKLERNSYSIELEKCSLNNLNEYNYLFNNSDLQYNKHFCLKSSQNLTIKGHYGDQINGFNTLKFHLIKCKNTSENNNHCKPSEEIDKYLTNTYVSIVYVSKSVDHFNTSNPIYSIINSDIFAIASKYIKRYYYFFSKEKYISDNGIIFNSNKEYDLFQYHHTNFDLIEKETQSNYSEETLLEINLTCMDLITEYTRNYIKIQDVLSYIGGIYDIISIFFHYISYNFIKKSFIIKIGSTFITSDSKTIISSKNNSDTSNDNILKIHKRCSNSFIPKKNKMKNFETINVCTLFNVNVKKNILDLFNIKDDDQIMIQNFEKNKKRKFSFYLYYYIFPFYALSHFTRYKTYELYQNIFQKFLSIDFFIPMILHSYQSLLS